MIEKTIFRLLGQNKTIALVTIIDKNGSAPRLPGSKMVVEQDGTLHGTIGGGKLEYTAHEKAKAVALGAQPLITEFDMRGSAMDGDADMVCGGIQIVLIERLTPDMAPMFERALTCFSGGAHGTWLVDVCEPKNPKRTFIDLKAGDEAPEGIDFSPVMRARTTRLLYQDSRKIVVDPLPKSGTVVLFGGGHVSREVAELAAYLDFDVIVCDDREEFANKQRFPMAKAVHVVDFTRALTSIDTKEELYLLIITRGHSFDQVVLAQALTTDARYIGMIGSRKKRDIIYDNLRTEGHTDTDLARVHCPVGLSIGSETPKEIAVSIIAELVAARAGVL